MTLMAMVFAAVEGEEPSKTAFYVAGGILAVWAVLVSAVGITKHDFPSTRGTATGVMAISAVLVAGTIAASLLTS